MGQVFGLLFFVPFLGLVLLVTTVQRRLYRAYIARYGDRRRFWQRMLYLPPDGLWWSMRFYFTRYDDPVVERLRRQYVLAFSVPFGLIFGFIALAVLAELSSR